MRVSEVPDLFPFQYERWNGSLGGWMKGGGLKRNLYVLWNLAKNKNKKQRGALQSLNLHFLLDNFGTSYYPSNVTSNMRARSVVYMAGHIFLCLTNLIKVVIKQKYITTNVDSRSYRQFQ